jgi:hypothetical protein
MTFSVVNSCLTIAINRCKMAGVNICSISGKAAFFGRVPYGCTRVTVWAVDGDMALVHALTAWHTCAALRLAQCRCDTGWDGPAWRVVPVEALSHFSDGWGSISRERAADVARALGSGWSAPFRKRTSP